jgi:transcriptional antiterminator NusG
MENCWYVVKVMPGKERSLNDFFNKEISLGKIKRINRFVCPTEREFVVVKKKKVLREKVLYSGYLYFESANKLSADELKEIATIPNIMGMMGDKTPLQLTQSDVRRILKDDSLEEHIESKRLKYINGDQIKVIDGAFDGFFGAISDIREDKVVVDIKIFGRLNSVTLNLSQIEKA